MQESKKAHSALISVFNKEGLAPIVKKLHSLNITLYSTGGTEEFIKALDIPVIPIEEVTSYPSILGGRVKTLHPKVFGGILNRQNVTSDVEEMEKYNLPQLDIVIVDLYPFEKTVASQATEQEIIEKIDIGGISLIRAAAKNYQDTLCVSSVNDYELFLSILEKNQGHSTLAERKHFAAKAFHISSHYDSAIFNYFNKTELLPILKVSEHQAKPLRYGENLHQEGAYYGDFKAMFSQLNGKELSYNNLLDVDAAVLLISEFTNEAPTFAILKHNNACGLAQRNTLKEAYLDALAADPISAFGGILVCNTTLDHETALEINSLFCEVVIAPSFTEQAQELLSQKKNRILLVHNAIELPKKNIRSALNGLLVQDKDSKTDGLEDLTFVTLKHPNQEQIEDLLFASKICKHTKSNTIVLAKNKQLIASGTGQTSRVDALKQAINKAKSFNFDLNEAVMASDAFFPFPDCVSIAHHEGINAVIQPGGSIKDQESIDFCNNKNMIMVFTGIRHFKH